MGHRIYWCIFIFQLVFIGTTVARAQTPQPGGSNADLQLKGASPLHAPSEMVGYDRGFYITDNQSLFHLTINGMTKTRFNLQGDESVENAAGTAPVASRTYHASFTVPFARLQLSGHVFSKQLKYNLFYNFPNNKLIYAWVAWQFIPKKLVVKSGLFKRPFGRGYLTSSVKRQFIDAPLGMAGTGSDIGVELANCYTGVRGLEWAIGVFNGTKGADGDFSPNITARLGYNNGISGYAETDFEGGGFRYGVGINGSTEFDHDDNNRTVHYLGGDAAVKVHGLSASGGVYFTANAEKNIGDGFELARIGSHVQAGYLIQNKVEPVLRYGFSHARHVKDDFEQEFTGGLVLHFFPGHRFKWENDITVRHTPPVHRNAQPALTDTLFVSQLQLYF